MPDVDRRPVALVGPVRIVGAGLLGASIGLALRARGIDVQLEDLDPANLRTASGLGAGVPVTGSEPEPQLVVVAVPPDHLARVIEGALEAHPQAFVTDVGSVKSGPLATVAEHADVARYCGSHPMAGTQHTGPLTASATLFEGRPWAVTPHATTSPVATQVVTELAELTGAMPLAFGPDEHDLAVARTSHVPHLMAALVAGRLADAPEGHLALSGPGVRDVTRVAGTDPGMWLQIVPANASAILALLGQIRADLDRLESAIESGDRDALRGVLANGVAGTRAIPGKHGGPVRPTSSVFVHVPDQPGNLARLFADVDAVGVNVEDVRIDHDPARAGGQVELVVDETRVEELASSLDARGWAVHQ
ncbi:prephenate dehydrogenase [Nocardioides jejuensis]|uniref:Prephenate dehydrogenase n=1 Tax=Nocardioides jejuensis TaxID=2502782 RepID=A0A4R1C0A8_9ACTN|nr:prephenate dehydrogenase [Nocardioides jejuensis]TCJ23427.1 prephenate dehydrogenase [Nocardioides jejuensis]